jgi:mannose-6-phosphate isomerase-like protein (cupin superfamily)
MDGGAGSVAVRPVTLEGLEAPWESLRFLSLSARASIGPRVLDSSEVVVYAERGTGFAQLMSGERFALEPGITFALPLGGTLHVVNTGDGVLDLIIAELRAHH